MRHWTVPVEFEKLPRAHNEQLDCALEREGPQGTLRAVGAARVLLECARLALLAHAQARGIAVVSGATGKT